MTTLVTGAYSVTEDVTAPGDKPKPGGGVNEMFYVLGGISSSDVMTALRGLESLQGVGLDLLARLEHIEWGV